MGVAWACMGKGAHTSCTSRTTSTIPAHLEIGGLPLKRHHITSFEQPLGVKGLSCRLGATPVLFEQEGAADTQLAGCSSTWE